MLTSSASASRRITDSRSSSILLFSTRLSQSSVRPTSAVEGDAVVDGQGLGHPSHASSLPTARETTPELVERQLERSCPSNSATASSAALPVRQGQAA